MPQLALNAKKVTRLYLHASVSGYTCMQAYPGGNTKRGKWVDKYMLFLWFITLDTPLDMFSDSVADK